MSALSPPSLAFKNIMSGAWGDDNAAVVELEPVGQFRWSAKTVHLSALPVPLGVLEDEDFVVQLFLGLPVAALASALVAAQPPASHRLDMTPVKPESVGFSSERLERLHTLIQDEIDKQQLAGAVTILARHGKVVDYRTYGYRDMASDTPMTKDTIFRDYSMTKPVTGVAMMILYEQGKWLPSDPISKYIPEFAHLKVYKGVDADGKMILVDPDHAPTMRELMTHTAGFGYGARQYAGRCDVSRPQRHAFGQSSGDDRQAGQDPAALSARQGLALQRLHGHPGLHRREALRPVAA